MATATVRSFGYLIAYVLPGSAALYSASLWSAWIKDFIDRVLGTETQATLFLASIMIAVGVGIVVSLMRSVVFERSILGSLFGDDAQTFRNKSGDGSLGTIDSHDIDARVTELYRFHQFYGGLAVILPFYTISWFIHDSTNHATYRLIIFAISALAAELLFFEAARASLKRYRESIGFRQKQESSSSAGGVTIV